MNRRGSALMASGVGLLTVGLLAVIAGLIYGSQAVRVHDQTGSTICGSVLSPRHGADSEGDIERGFLGLPASHQCASRLDDRRRSTRTLLWGGAALAVLSIAGLLVPALVVRREEPRPFALDEGDEDDYHPTGGRLA